MKKRLTAMDAHLCLNDDMLIVSKRANCDF